MNTNRKVWAFGCSFTTGDGLSNPVPGMPNVLAYPQLVANHFGMTCMNKGKSGSSNKSIHHRIMNRFQGDENDIVLVTWTYPHRSCILTDREEETVISLHSAQSESPGNISEAFYEHFYSDYESNFELNLRMHHAYQYLSSMNVRQIHIMYDLKLFRREKFNTTPVQTFDFKTIKNKHPLGEDGLHPGENAHTEYAATIISKIQDI